MTRFDAYLDWLVDSAASVAGEKPRGSRPVEHPGIVLARDYLANRGLSQSELARRIGCTHAKINDVVNGRRGISAKLALDLERVLGTPASLWVSIQGEFDIAEEIKRARTKNYGRSHSGT